MANEPNERGTVPRSFAVEFISWNPLGQPKPQIACVKPPETAKPIAFTRPVHFFVAPPKEQFQEEVSRLNSKPQF